MLVLHANQVVSIDHLVDGLWGQAPPDSATNTVQVYISRLRKLHADPQEGPAALVLVRRRPGYLLELDADELDLARYEWLTHQGTQALPRRPDSPQPSSARRWAVARPAAGGVHRRAARSPSAPGSRSSGSPSCKPGLRPTWPLGGTPSWSGSWRHWSRAAARGAAPAAPAQPVPLWSPSRGAGGLSAGPPNPHRGVGHRSRPCAAGAPGRHPGPGSAPGLDPTAC